MTPKQFLKKFVAKEQRLEAEEQLDSMLMISEELGYDEAKDETCRSLRGLSNEIKQW